MIEERKCLTCGCLGSVRGVSKETGRCDSCSTMRDMFAMYALQGLLASSPYAQIVHGPVTFKAYELADSMMEERKLKNADGTMFAELVK